MHRLISTSFVLKHADGRALALASIKPIVAHKALRLLNDWHELLAYPAIDLCTVLWIKVIVTNNGEHDALLSLNFRFQLSSAKGGMSTGLSCPTRIAHSSSTNAVSFSSACTTKRFPSSLCASKMSFHRAGRTGIELVQ